MFLHFCCIKCLTIFYSVLSPCSHDLLNWGVEEMCHTWKDQQLAKSSELSCYPSVAVYIMGSSRVRTFPAPLALALV